MPSYGGEAERLWRIWDWSGKDTMSYRQFLQAKQFESSIRFAIDDQTKQLIGSNAQISAMGYKAVADTIERSHTVISREIANVTDEIRRSTDALSQMLNWGFSETLMALGRIEGVLRSPSGTWATEQYEIAQDQFRRGLYPEALASARRAANGHGSHVGLSTDPRFHFLAGVVQLGSYRNSDPAVVDPAAAEQSFLLAARCARSDNSNMTAEALTCAARSALVDRRFTNAMEHAEAALPLFSHPKSDPQEPVIRYNDVITSRNSAAALYILAKAFAGAGRSEDAAAALFAAIANQPDLSLAAAAEPDFRGSGTEEVAAPAISQATACWRAALAPVESVYRAGLRQTLELRFGGVACANLDEARTLTATIQQFDLESRADTLLTHYTWFHNLLNSKPELNQLSWKFHERAKSELMMEAPTKESQEADEKSAFGQGCFATLAIWIGIAIVFNLFPGFFLGFFHGMNWFAAMLIYMPLLLAWISMPLWFGNIWISLSRGIVDSNNKSKKNEIQRRVSALRRYVEANAFIWD